MNLPECERLRRAAFLADGCVHECGDIAAHLVVGLGVPDGPREPGVRHEHRTCGAGGRQVFQRDRTVAAESSRSGTTGMAPIVTLMEIPHSL
jgi:hypothetical protein